MHQRCHYTAEDALRRFKIWTGRPRVNNYLWFVEISIDKSNDFVRVKGAMDMKLLTTTLRTK
ncbi:hypothetical protein HanXRQr2_Chr16g0730511 [Helianthus annuus]|uniref:Uncharacterized protein n=1 Tax=Helianthus annuus TaxID=4232 RepID=A0A251RX23_HELAN|nr:hypothetical protein HanXRQr2_Chr16g0730511 [Helianthus annuus]